MPVPLKNLLLAVSRITTSQWASPLRQAARLLAQRHIAHLSVVYFRLEEKLGDPLAVASQFDRRAFLLFQNRIDQDTLAALNLPADSRASLIQAAASESWQLIQSHRQNLTRQVA